MTIGGTPMDPHLKRRLLELNDARLHPLIEAGDAADRQAAIERIVLCDAAAVVRKIVARYCQSNNTLRMDDAEEVTAAVALRLVRRLQVVPSAEEEAISSIDDYVAKQTYNTIYDVLRRRFPQRTRLKNRLRYVLERDPRLATWTTSAGLTAGLRAMQGTAAPQAAAIVPELVQGALHDRRQHADALVALFTALGHPLLLDAVVRIVAEAWNVTDTPPVDEDVTEAIDEQPSQFTRIAMRQYLEALWEEIRELRAPQRAALLLNLRDVEGMNAVALFVVVGIATIDEIAEAIGVTAERLAELWNRLPLDDLTIGSMLGLTRQQVINLRKSARERLARRTNNR